MAASPELPPRSRRAPPGGATPASIGALGRGEGAVGRRALAPSSTIRRASSSRAAMSAAPATSVA